MLTRAAGNSPANACSGYGTPTTIAGNPSQSGLAEGCYLYTLTGTDRVGNVASVSTTVKVDKTAPARQSQRSGRRQRAGGGDLQRDRRRLGRERGQRASSNAPWRPTPRRPTRAAPTPPTRTSARKAPASPYTDTTVTSGHCYEYEYTVPDLAGNSATSAASAVKVDTAGPALPEHRRHDARQHRRPAAGRRRDHAHLQRSDRLVEHREQRYDHLLARGVGATQLAVGGLGSGNWSAGDTGAPHYTKTGGTSPLVSCSTS